MISTNSTSWRGVKEKRSLSVADLCAILDACGKAQVTVLKFGDLHVAFGTQAEKAPPPSVPRGTSVEENVKEALSRLPATEIAGTQQQEATRNLANDERALKKDQLALMAIENPALLEELIQSGELDEDVGEDNGQEA